LLETTTGLSRIKRGYVTTCMEFNFWSYLYVAASNFNDSNKYIVLCFLLYLKQHY